VWDVDLRHVVPQFSGRTFGGLCNVLRRAQRPQGVLSCYETTT
jgi:hypothetical protein